MVDRGHGFRALSRSQSLRYLAEARIGRVVLNVDALPVAVPVNFSMVGDDIVFCTAGDSKVSLAAARNVLAFVADELDVDKRTGWSVIVRGFSSEITESEEVASLRRAGLRPWAGEEPSYIRIRSELVSGRAYLPALPAMGQNQKE